MTRLGPVLTLIEALRVVFEERLDDDVFTKAVAAITEAYGRETETIARAYVNAVHEGRPLAARKLAEAIELYNCGVD